MVFKELDAFTGGAADLDARLVADRMAYFLRRHYRRSTAVDVLNGLRIPADHTVASLDHLLLHAHGWVLIAREAVGGTVEIDGEGRWLYRTDAGPVSVASPITHAYVQGLLLKSFLDRRVQQRGFFDRLELDVLVVVPDEVEIRWPPTGPLAEVCKRDDVFERVSQRLAQCASAASGPGPLNRVERQVLGDFLCRAHIPDVGPVAGA